MVGVPRSSGCRICVQRRVRCDGTRPTCNNCRKGNRPCPGYGPGVKFQDEGPRLREKYQKGKQEVVNQDAGDNSSDWALTPSLASTSTASSNSSSDSHLSRKHWNILALDAGDHSDPERLNVLGFVEGKMKDYLDMDLFENLYQYGARAYMSDEVQLASPGELSTIFLKPVFSPEAHQLQLLAKFTNTITLRESRFLPKAMQSQAAWLSQIPSMSGTSLLLDCAIRAVTLVHIGILHKSMTFIVESRPYYGKALKLLNSAIADKELGMENKTLCAVILLSFYEMFASDSDRSWIRHAGGAGALMRARGPERHRHGFDRDIFMAYRHTLIIESFSNDVPSFLDEPEWRQLSRGIYNDLRKNHLIPADRIEIFDNAEDFYSEMAAISVTSADVCHLLPKIMQHGVSEKDGVLAHIQKLQSHHDNLHTIYAEWRAAIKRSGHEPPLEPVDDPVVKAQYRYSNVFIASFDVGMWTTMMLVNQNQFQLSQAIRLSTPQLILENEKLAMQACRIVDYMLTSSFLGPFFTIFALRYAFRIFKPGDIRSDWVLCKLMEIGDRRMQFAKATFEGWVRRDMSPEQFYQSAKERLALYSALHGVETTEVG